MRDRAFLGLGDAEQVPALLRELIELVALLLLLRPGLLERDLSAEQLCARRGHFALGRSARANRVLIGPNDVAKVVPAFDEVGERVGGEQHVDVTEVAVLVGVDEPVPIRIVVPAQARLSRVELRLVRHQSLFVGVDVRRNPIEIDAHERNGMVGLIELTLQRADLRPRSLELLFLGVEFEVNVVHLALMLADLLVDRRSSQRKRQRREGDEDEDERKSGPVHARRWSLTQTDRSIDFACFLSSAAISPTCWYEAKARS